MLKTAVTPAQFWADRFAPVTQEWCAEINQIIADAEPRRARADFNTGSISRTSALALRSVAEWTKPELIAEVGTFIGVSTHALARSGALVWTCDISNDCFKSHGKIACFPFEVSTKMFTRLVDRTAAVDLFFIDGLLPQEDAALIQQLSRPSTVYVFDDYNGNFKGVANVALLRPHLPNHVLMPPDGPIKDDTTLAALVPVSRL